MVKRLAGQHASCFDVNLQQIHVDDPSLTGRSLGCLARTEFRHKAVERLEEINLMTFVPLTTVTVRPINQQKSKKSKAH